MALEPTVIQKHLEADETQKSSQTLKIKIPHGIKIRNHIVWNPILTEEITVYTKNPNEDWEKTTQINRDINRVTIDKVLDLEEFIWKI